MLKELVKNEIQKLTWNIEDLEKEIQKSKELLLEKTFHKITIKDLTVNVI